jgi:rubrerythrin
LHGLRAAISQGGVVAPAGLTALEALGIAIRREMDAGETYRDLAAGCDSPLARDRFLLLQHEAQQHETMLRSRYDEMFPDVKLSVPRSAKTPVPAVAGGHGDGLKGALGYAVEAERRAREFYMEASVATSDPTGQNMFRYLADVHGRHQMMLESEYDTVLRYPHAFDDPQAPWRPERRSRPK